MLYFECWAAVVDVRRKALVEAKIQVVFEVIHCGTKLSYAAMSRVCLAQLRVRHLRDAATGTLACVGHAVMCVLVTRAHVLAMERRRRREDGQR